MVSEAATSTEEVSVQASEVAESADANLTPVINDPAAKAESLESQARQLSKTLSRFQTEA